jgi:polynucleotide 5'-kinase involved in rRNA processing
MMIVGETGAGKTTLTYSFAGKLLEAIKTEEGYFAI